VGGESCDEVASAAALITALAVEASLGAPVDPAPSPASAVTDPTPVPPAPETPGVDDGKGADRAFPPVWGVGVSGWYRFLDGRGARLRWRVVR
jgi:hypothetical protein